MAYMDQTRKARIAAELKKVMPQGWKYSLGVQNHSTIVLTIQSAPVDLIAAVKARSSQLAVQRGKEDYCRDIVHAQLNEFHLDMHFEGELLETFQRIKAALNDGNHDRSDIMSDYFDVGWYVYINLGKWDKPFVHTANK